MVDYATYRARMPKKLLSIEDLADYLNVEVTTVYRWNQLGTGPRYIKVGRYVRYRPEDVEVWLDARTVGGREAP